MSAPSASVQLYTLAPELAADMEGSLERLAQLGLKHVEAFDFVDRASRLRQALDATGLTAPTAHAPLLSDELWTPKGSIPAPAPERVFEAAATVGVATVIDPYVETSRWLTREGADDIAERLNGLAEIAAGFGLTVGYHNHAQEFIAEFADSTAFEHVIGNLNDQVKIELDLYWATVGGQDVTKLAERLGSRLVAVHVKDGLVIENPWVPGRPDLDVKTLVQTPAGAGEIPLGSAIRANSAIEYAIIEYDNAPGDVFEAVEASLRFLRTESLVQK